MTYTITVGGIGEQHIAEAIASKLDQGGAAFEAGVSIEVREDTAPATSPVWTNRVTQPCEACGGHGHTGIQGLLVECNACQGTGTVDAR